MIIRPEVPQDIKPIEQITIAAFAGKLYSDETEHLIINRLREAGGIVPFTRGGNGRKSGRSCCLLNCKDQC